MTTLTIDIPEKELNTLLAVLKKFGAKVHEKPSTGPTTKIKQLAMKKSVLSGLEKGLKQAKLMSEGKLKGGTIKDLLNGK